MNDQKIMQEINELMNITEVKAFFSRALEEAKKEFKNQIKQYRDFKNKAEEKKEEASLAFQSELPNKSYFFELNRIEGEESMGKGKWEVGKFKIDSGKDIVQVIVSEFIKEADTYESIPQEIQTARILSPEGKLFEINFMKNTDNRVIGFVKEVKKEKEEYVLNGDGGMVKIKTKYQDLDKEEMYKKIFQLMEENPEAREDIFFYYLMAQPKEESSKN